MKALAVMLCAGIELMTCSAAMAQSEDVLSLSEAVAAAIEYHPAIRSARLHTEAAAIQVNKVFAARLPVVRVSESVTYGNNPVFVFGSLLEQARFGAQDLSLSNLNRPGALTNYRTSLTLSVPSLNRARHTAQTQQARQRRRQADLQEAAAEQRIRAEVIGAYFGLAAASASYEAGVQGVRAGEADLERTRDRVEAGLAVRSDFLAAQVQLAEIKQEEIRAQGAVKTAQAQLNILMGAPFSTRYRLITPFDTGDFLVSDDVKLQDNALRKRPELMRSESVIEAATDGAAERRSEYHPDVSVSGDIGASSRSVTRGSLDFSLGASLTFTLFDRTRRSNSQLAQVEIRLASAERDRLKDQILLEVVQSTNAYRAAIQQMDVATKASEHAIEALRIIRDRYEAGLATISELLTSEAALARARTNVIASRHRHYLSYANLMLSTGELTNVQAFEP